MSPPDLRGPGFGAAHDDVAHRIFDVVVGVNIVWMALRQCNFNLGVGLGRGVMVSQVVAKEQRISLICATGKADMEIDGSLVIDCFEEPFLPIVRVFRCPRRPVITIELLEPPVPRASERLLDRDLELGGSDLDVDDVFGSQPRHGGRADVIDAQSELTKNLA